MLCLTFYVWGSDFGLAKRSWRSVHTVVRGIVCVAVASVMLMFMFLATFAPANEEGEFAIRTMRCVADAFECGDR